MNTHTIRKHLAAAYKRSKCATEQSLLRRALISMKLADVADDLNESRYYLEDAHTQVRVALETQRRITTMLHPVSMS